MSTSKLDGDGFYYRLADCTDPIRIAKQISEDGKRRYKGFNSFSDVTDFVRKNEHLSLHEVTRCGDENGGNQRIFLDIDAKQEDFPNISTKTLEYACEILIQSAREVLRYNGITDMTHVTLVSHRPGKFSKHVVFNNAYIDVNHYKCFYNDLANAFAFNLSGEKLPSELINMIDAGVYDTRHCLRLHTSVKFGCDVRLTKECATTKTEKFDAETMVTFVPQDMLNRPKLQFYKCPVNCSGPAKPKYESSVSEDHLKIAEQILDSMQDEGISVAKMGYPFIRLNVDHSKPCPVCGNKHDSENVMAVVNTEVLRLICRRKQKGEENRSRVIHTFGRYIEDVPTLIEEIKSIKIIKTTSNFLNSIDEQMSKCDRLFIRSDMNSAKSTRTHEYIESQIKLNPDFCCIFLTYRINLASAILAATNKYNPFEKYDEIASYKISLNEHKKIIIQLESLGRLEYDLADDKRIDLVIIDEAVSFCQQNLSCLNKKMNAKNQMMLRNILKNSEKTIIMDALLDTPTIDAYKCLLPKDEQTLWINEPTTLWAPQVENFKDAVKWRKQLSDSLISGQKIYVAITNGEKSIKQLERYLLKRKRDLKILTIYGGGENNDFIVSNINRELVKYDCVIASPCMSAGISFDVRDHFDAVYAFIDNKGPTAIDIIQSLRRVRNTKTNTLVLCNSCSAVQLPTSYKDIFEDEQKRLKFNSWDYINDGFSLELNKNNMYFKHPDDDGLKWKIHCIRIANLNKIDRYTTVINYLKTKGATLIKTVNIEEENNDTKQARKEFVNDGIEIKKENATKIAKTSLITEKEYESLRSRGKKYISINHEKVAGITETDNDLMEKFRLLRHYGLHEDLFAEDNKKARTDPFNNPSFVEKYSKREVMECYKSIIYRDLTNEQIKEIDDNNTAKLVTDEDKIDHEYLFGRHVTINKIKDLFTSGTVESGVLINCVSEIHKLGNPLLKRYREINENTVLNAVNKIISPYGYKIGSKQARDGDNIKRFYIWKNYSSDLFTIKKLPINSDELTILAVKQSGISEKPVAIIYEK